LANAHQKKILHKITALNRKRGISARKQRETESADLSKEKRNKSSNFMGARIAFGCTEQLNR